MIKILGLDPGHSTGYCVLQIDNKIPKLIRTGTCKDQTLQELEDCFKEVDYIVCEDFLINKAKAEQGAFNNSRLQTVQVIGAIQLLARLNHREVVLQQNNIKPMGYGYAKLPYKKGAKGVHVFDAVAHAFYFAVKKGLCAPLR